MFLSTENPPRDPLSSSSSSSNLLRLTTTSSSHELGLSNFSIRDYAYSNRKNNIKKSWPFSTKSLHLFSSHGVTDPLPPFQKFETTAGSSSGKQTVSHVHHQTIAETSKGVCIKNGLFTSTSVSKSKVEIVVAATSNNKSNRKCGRGGGGGMVKSKEESCGVLVTTTASESKTCPICKAFSSASNTTLNAHIDQCLSVNSAMPPASNKPNKPRVKPAVDSAVPPVSSSKASKTRVNQCMSVDSVAPLVSSKLSRPRAKPLMKIKTLVDIYATAKRCTLADLDKRNGTQWASVLSRTNRVAADVSKKRKASPVGVGPVYIDAKGQKLRILTEFSDKKTCTTITPLREQHEDGISSKENSKSLRKRRCGKKHAINHKANASEKVPENQREGSSSKGPRRIYNQRMLPKRGLVSKKLNEKKGHKFYALRDQPSEEDDDEWSGGDRLVLSGADPTPLNKQKLRSQVSGKNNKTMFESKRDRVELKKKSFGSIQEDRYPPGKNVREVADATNMRNLSPPFVANGWRLLSPPVELKRARLDLSEEEEEETGKWESEMTQERELSDDDYVSGDDNNPSFSRYYDYDNDDDEETSEEEEDYTKRANVLDKTDDTANETCTPPPPSNETIPPRERAMYYSEEVVGDMMIYEQTACDEEEDVRFGSEVIRGKGSLFVEVDTIPIPGPPGSFLPSPRGMCFDENLGQNSSVVTSQFQSSMDQQLDRNSSESPVSAVSNFPAGRFNFPTEFPSSLDIPSMSFCVPSHHGTIPEAEPMSVDKETPTRFRNNDHDEPCCCQRKDRISLNHEASHLLQRRAAAAASSSVAMNLTKSPPNDAFEQSPYMIQYQEFNLHSKFCSSAVVPPSPSNSVLRLMGKDLMVMNQGEADNKEEEASRISLKPTPQFHDHPQPCAGTGLYFNTSLCLRNSFESSSHQQPQTPVSQQQTQASPFRYSFDHVRYFSPS